MINELFHCRQNSHSLHATCGGGSYGRFWYAGNTQPQGAQIQIFREAWKFERQAKTSVPPLSTAAQYHTPSVLSCLPPLSMAARYHTPSVLSSRSAWNDHKRSSFEKSWSKLNKMNRTFWCQSKTVVPPPCCPPFFAFGPLCTFQRRVSCSEFVITTFARYVKVTYAPRLFFLMA